MADLKERQTPFAEGAGAVGAGDGDAGGDVKLVASAGTGPARPPAGAAAASAAGASAAVEVPAANGTSGRPESGTYVRESARFGGEPYIRAHDLELKTFAGYAFRSVDVDVHRGEFVAVRGRNGSGKTALLLTLAGRMKPTGGTLEVGGYELPRQRAKVERRVGLGLFSGLNDLQESLTVLYALGAEFELYGRKPRREAVAGYLREWGLADVANVRVKDLTSEKLAQLGIALAFVGEPDAVVVDDVESQLTMSQSEGLVQLLLDAARTRGAAIVVGVVERDLAAMADATVYLSKEGE